jgi:Xaa-Pro aminopeptidase
MKYEQIDSKLFIENREKFKQQMKPNSIALFSSNYEYVLNGDATHTFKQNSNLFWL